MSEHELHVVEMDMDLKRKEFKWSWAKFAIGWSKIFVNMATIAWGIYTSIMFWVLAIVLTAKSKELLEMYLSSTFMIILASGWVVLSVIVGCNLQKAVSTMLENAKINAEFKAGFMKDISLKGTADAAQIAEAIKKV